MLEQYAFLLPVPELCAACDALYERDYASTDLRTNKLNMQELPGLNFTVMAALLMTAARR